MKKSNNFVIISFFVSVLFALACEKQETIAEKVELSGSEPSQSLFDSHIVITENGITSAIVQAESVSVWADSNLTRAHGGLKVDFYSKKGEHISTLTSKSGEVFGLFTQVDSIRADGDVIIVSDEKKTRMEASSSLVWIAATRKIYSDSLVKLISNTAVEEGIKFSAKDDLSEYTMENVSGSYNRDNMSIPGR